MRLIRNGSILAAATLISCSAYLLWNNNRDTPPPSPEELRASFGRAVIWITERHADIAHSENDILLWMIKQAADLSADERLQTVYSEYKHEVLDKNPRMVWQHYFSPYSSAPVLPEMLAGLPDYNLYFIYGLTCNEELGSLDIVQQQNNEDFCRNTHPLSPSCVTHQMMGARFAQRRDCGDAETVQRLISALQEKIYRQLTWDPRVVDVYMQRALMLADSGATQRIKPVWIRHILAAQLPDGGWGGFQPLIPVGDRYIGFSGRGITMRTPRSDLHTTAQGLFLLSILLHDRES